MAQVSRIIRLAPVAYVLCAHAYAQAPGSRSLISKINPRDGLTYVYIAPGTFPMGCVNGDRLCDADEKPKHNVHISKAFWISQTLTTQDAYKRVTGTNPSRFQWISDTFHVRPLGPPDGRLPVDSVNWRRARAYCEQVGMRLPTEAEWEFAARADEHFGRFDESAINRIVDSGWKPEALIHPEMDAVSWYEYTITRRCSVPALAKTLSGAITSLPAAEIAEIQKACTTPQPVAQKAANDYGLYDMQGNLLEWVADWYGPYPEGGVNDPKGPDQGDDRVLRGAFFMSPPELVRVTHRAFLPPDITNYTIGFRCAGERVPE